MTRSSSSSLTTRRVPSPLTANQSSSSASSVTSRLRRSNRSSAGRGRSSSRSAPPSPSTPADRGPPPGQAALDRAQAGVAGLDHRDRHHALGQAVGVDVVRPPGSGSAAPPTVGASVAGVPADPGHRAAAGQRAERGRGGGGQRHQVGTAAERERQVERLRVVDRVEAAPGQERQVQPVGGEHRIGVGEPAVGHIDPETPLAAPRRGGPSGSGAAAAARAGTRPARPSPGTRPGRRRRRRRRPPAR